MNETTAIALLHAGNLLLSLRNSFLHKRQELALKAEVCKLRSLSLPSWSGKVKLLWLISGETARPSCNLTMSASLAVHPCNSGALYLGPNHLAHLEKVK